MLKIDLAGVKNTNDYQELIKVFLSDGEYQLVHKLDSEYDPISEEDDLVLNIPQKYLEPYEKKDQAKRYIYDRLKEITGKTPKWGTLTGVKPLKLYNILRNANGIDKAKKILAEEYVVDDEKIHLLENIDRLQRKRLDPPDSKKVSLYIGIPFCPTRCSYCSFTSNQEEYGEIEAYLDALYKEIDYVSINMKEHGLTAETVYIGGGTPTTLNSKDLGVLTEKVCSQIPTVENLEFTVEAGRPDTIDEEKLTQLRNNGVNRISINPQTMHDKSLTLIGRDHTAQQIRDAMSTAKKMNFDVINADLIAGLPEETIDDFIYTVKEILKFQPENITIHTLALKRGSQFFESMKDKKLENVDEVYEMVKSAFHTMSANGYDPYYIYRQKYMADNLENVGYAKDGAECIYNIRIMDEKQTVIALGAGGSTKVYYPEENRIERIFNVSNYSLYIERIDEMIERKEKGLFNQ